MDSTDKRTKQYLLTPSCGKRLIARSVLSLPIIEEALTTKTIVIIAGTTNGYIAEELLGKIGQVNDFSKKRFFRGITLHPGYETMETGRIKDESKFIGDVVISKGIWERGKTIFDASENLKQGDIIIKGANALNLETMQAGLLIGHPMAGTIIPVIQSVAGRRVELILPIGLEKRVSTDINKLALLVNSQNASGLRYLPITGNVITEITAIKILTGAEAELFAAGGVEGAEGSIWLAVTGNKEQIEKAEEIMTKIRKEEKFQV
jgi:hypothetical protein